MVIRSTLPPKFCPSRQSDFDRCGATPDVLRNGQTCAQHWWRISGLNRGLRLAKPACSQLYQSPTVKFPMAIRTEYVAFDDFYHQALHRPPFKICPRYFYFFIVRIAMVKIQTSLVGFSTLYTFLMAAILPQPFSNIRFPFFVVRQSLCFVLLIMPSTPNGLFRFVFRWHTTPFLGVC